jgi:Ca-activated chloride channel family protein
VTFAEPLWLWAVLALPLLAAVEIAATRRDRERTARLVARPLWSRVVRKPSERFRFLRLALLLIGALNVVLALARPQWGIVREKVEREGKDVVLALDTSGSMATEDVPPSRFFLARAALAGLVQRLESDRVGLLAFEGEAYPLVPLTLDADALLLFLETIEPGIVPAPGSSLGRGLAKGLEMFVDEQRRNKVMVLVSDGEDLEGDVEEAIRRAKAAGVVVHTVGVGTEQGQPVPDFDREGQRAGFKRDESGAAVVSRLQPQTLDAIARGTGGRFVRVSGADTSLAPIAAAIEGMEQQALAREYSYRKKERFQLPLGVALASLTLALILPLPPLCRGGALAHAAMLGPFLLCVAAALPARGQTSRPPLAASPSPAPAEAAQSPGPSLVDELLLKPTREAARGRKEYEAGNHPAALEAFAAAAAARPADARARFNLGAGLYKNGKLDEAGAVYRELGANAASPLSASAQFNLGNTLFQKQDYPGAVRAYRHALRADPADASARRNLELALRALRKQQEQKQQEQQKDDQQKEGQQDKSQDRKAGEKEKAQKADRDGQPKTQEQKEQERFQKEAGMPKERAMQLLDALQQNEKAEQKKQIAARKAQKKRGKDW